MTNTDRWRRIEGLYDEALARPGPERTRFLQEVCGEDEALRRDVESLLAADRDAGTFLETPAADILREHREANTLIGRQLGPYRIESLLGAGGMGEVYAAQDTRLDRRVAIKVLPAHFADRPEALERFEREARSIAALSHPHICTLYDVGTEDGTKFLVMELLEGETLDQRLRRGRLSLGEALQYATEIAEGLDAAHRRGIVHRDLKPANVMLTEAGTKLLDFGVARSEVQEHDSAALRALTLEGTIVGTLPYMAPEQLEGKKSGARTDLFAFGAILYEMVAGRPAFAGDSRAMLIAGVLTADPPPLDRFEPLAPAALQRVVAKCLAKDPDVRWQSAREVVDELSAIASDDRPTRARGEAGRAQRWPASRAAWIVVGTSVLIAALIAAARLMPSRATRNEARPLRFVVAPPPNATFSIQSAASLAVSPDGRSLAFTASSSQGNLALWVRAFDSLDARQLPGTDGGAGQPFWSPDGRYLAYFAPGGKQRFVLKKIDVTGGLPQLLADIGGSQTGTWSSDGVIVLRPNAGAAKDGSLYRMSAAGGPLTRLTNVDTSRGEFSHNWPQFLPDGRHFLYVANSSQPENDGVVYLGSLDAPTERTRLFASDSNVAYAVDHLIYMRGNTLLAQPFDPGHLRVTGEATSIAEQVERNPGSRRGAFSLSATGAVLAYRPLGESQLVWYDRNGKRFDPIGPAGNYSNPALSPDERTVAVARRDPATSASDIWLIDVARGTMSRFTIGGSAVDMPLWSRDGTRIVFKSRRLESDSPEGWRFREKPTTGVGNETTLLTGLDPFCMPLGWSTDGRFLVYGSASSAADVDLWLLPQFGDRKPVPFLRTPFSESQATLSPDGRWVAYVTNESGRNEVYVRRFPSGDGQLQISIAGGLEPTWRPDGKELFFLAPDHYLMAVTIGSGSTVQPGTPVRLFETAMANLTYGTRNQYVVASQGGRFLINQPAREGSPAPITVLVNWPAVLKQ